MLKFASEFDVYVGDAFLSVAQMFYKVHFRGGQHYYNPDGRETDVAATDVSQGGIAVCSR
jgi:hypothetical protein